MATKRKTGNKKIRRENNGKPTTKLLGRNNNNNWGNRINIRQTILL